MKNKTLADYSNQFNSDKGKAHSYVPFYEKLFEKKRHLNLNILEIGILFGDSLKLWNSYFEHATIFGIDDFSQPDGQEFHNYMPVNKNEVLETLKQYPRINPLVFDSENKEEIKSNLNHLKLDIIIDDASHALDNQINNLTNFLPYLNSDGFYICEDIQTRAFANILLSHANNLNSNIYAEIIEFNVNERLDDRLLFIHQK